MEQYATFPNNGPLQDRQAEAVLATLVEEGPKAMQAPEDYDVEPIYVGVPHKALNGVISCGMPQDWSTHDIGHELTALYGIDHARTLAIVLPGVWRFFINEKKKSSLNMAKEF
jgi:NADP-dependent alcohol dehydrogenase